MYSANNDDFDSSDNDQEKDSNDDEILASISTSSSNLNYNLEEEVKKVQCLFDRCDTEYMWLGSTSNLLSYLRDIHQITKESLANKLVKVHQQTIQQPIYLVEIDDFKLLIKSFDSRFKMPCVSTIKTIIFGTYTLVVKQIIDLILGMSDTVSLTFDIWSSRVHDGYIKITCYWLTESFELHKIILEIGKLNNHYAFDIVESVNSVLDKFNINRQKCAEHILQLSVNLELKQVNKLISKCKTLVSILSKEKKIKQLRKAQLQINLGLKKPLDVIKNMDIR
ncbi:22339_t:CDS:2 [Cetraspora pellucida]|uniref:22339_t:CDS:1 n=1 Tax=Cetraspora pellucida TaxID=1433469 RepID=A0A9N9NJ14_9GLOM|nr:22339_t:CDS:2 [Cetraspora pellucida]